MSKITRIGKICLIGIAVFAGLGLILALLAPEDAEKGASPPKAQPSASATLSPTAEPAEETPAPEPSPTPIEEPEPTLQEPEASESVDPALVNLVFIQVVREATSEFEGVPDRVLIKTARAACGAWQRGASFLQTATIAIEEGFSGEATGALLGAGGQAYCPEDLARVQPGLS